MEKTKSWEEIYDKFKSCVEEVVEKLNLDTEKRSFKIEGHRYDFYFVKNVLCKIEAFSPKSGLVEIYERGK